MRTFFTLTILMCASFTKSSPTPDYKVAYFGGGCFWCTEAMFEQLPGVADVLSGYQGGSVNNPTYEQVCGGRTGHAEVIRIQYDPAVISYEQLLERFFAVHDPTTLNRQGADRGTQYRSVIFTTSEAQRASAEAMIAALNRSGRFQDPIVTEVKSAPRFYPAEAYHQDYFRTNPSAAYCRLVIAPKLQKHGDGSATPSSGE